MLLFLIKFLHSLIVIYLLICLYWLWQYALQGQSRQYLGVAIGSILLEAVVFTVSDFTCPLTTWAIALGDETGTDFFSEFFYLDRINYVGSYTLFAICGMGMAAWRYLKQLNIEHQKI